uniref:Uncharacterized protein n=1 Tax=Gallus gallus TaxID=9031 RepID=A0A8V0ZUK0_CHICK
MGSAPAPKGLLPKFNLIEKEIEDKFRVLPGCLCLWPWLKFSPPSVTIASGKDIAKTSLIRYGCRCVYESHRSEQGRHLTFKIFLLF